MSKSILINSIKLSAYVGLATFTLLAVGCSKGSSAESNKADSSTVSASGNTAPAAVGATSSSLKSDERLIKGGSFTRLLDDGKTVVTVNSYYLDKKLTTVEEFDEFVKKTNYTTEADKFGNSAVLQDGNWTLKEGANYWYPLGKDKPKATANHPVTQVSWNDVVAYAKWKGKRLPTEVEWEYAATNAGATNFKFPWGNDVEVNGKYVANTFQGTFPSDNTALDGFEFTSPVGYYPANELGLFDIGGNVWEFTANPIPPTPEQAAQDPSLRIPLKGGSFATDFSKDADALIFHHSSTTPETGVFHTGFRLARDDK